MTSTPLQLYFVTAPGLEATLCEEVRSLGFDGARAQRGGVSASGGWSDVWRANRAVRGATRILVEFASFRVVHLSQLDKRARKLDWGAILKPGVPVRVEASCRSSKIYHAGAAQERIETAIREAFESPVADDAPVTIRVRIDNNVCTLSVDSSGEPLHKRGFKLAVAKAPLRETLAALFLRQAGFAGTEPVIDPLCGSGTFAIEAAEMAAGLWPGRARTFAFEQLATYDAGRDPGVSTQERAVPEGVRFYGFDRDENAVRMARENAERAGVTDLTVFKQQPLSALTRPEGPAGLILSNPPYGGRIGNKARLAALYRAFGDAVRRDFAGWRAGLVTDDEKLARATGLSFAYQSAPVDHGGITVKLYLTARPA